MSDNENRIVITDADLNSEKVVESVRAMQEAAAFTTVRSVGAPAPKNAGGLSILILTGAGILGGLVAYLMQKLVLEVILKDASTTVTNLFFTFILAFFIGTTVALVDAATTRIGSKIAMAAGIAIPTSIVSGFALGALANAFYSNATTRIYTDAYTRLSNGESEEAITQFVRNSLHLPRGIAWMVVGIAAGITVGVASRSLKRTGLTIAGGAVGGFIGGFIFDFIPDNLLWLSQSAGITITGLLIGLSMAVLEQAARTQWIEIVEGGMAGKQFILYKSDITIGSSPTADITLIKDPAIAPIHARIFAAAGRSQIESLDPTRPISVNGTVGMRIQLEDSVYITIGSTQVLFREKAGASKTVTGNVGRLS
jgi:MFS family permease